MGVKLRDLVFDYRHPMNRTSLNGKLIALDTNLLVYQNVAVFGDRVAFTDGEGNSTNHLIGLFYRIIGMLEHQVKPIFVFDGKPIHMKEKTIAERGTNSMKEAVHKAMGQTRELIELFGIPIINAVHDAEAELANLSKARKVDYVSTLDYDIFLFGAENILRFYPSSKKRMTEYVNLQEFLKGVGFSQEQLIYYGMLLGTDFNDKIPKVGPKKALELVKKYKTWDRIKYAVEDKHLSSSIESCFGQDPEEVIDYFLNPPPATHLLTFSRIKFKEITDYLVEKRFNKGRIANAFTKLRKKHSSESIEKWL